MSLVVKIFSEVALTTSNALHLHFLEAVILQEIPSGCDIRCNGVLFCKGRLIEVCDSDVTALFTPVVLQIVTTYNVYVNTDSVPIVILQPVIRNT